MSIVEDLALIQCFHGQSPLHIQASKIALANVLMCNPRPQDWIFVEAQKPNDQYHFEYLSGYGIKYVKKVIEPINEDIFQKEQLWNIGVHQTDCKYLCFVDGDVCYEDKDFLQRAKGAFLKGDVIQLHNQVLRQNEMTEYVFGTAYCVMQKKYKEGRYGKPGFDLGMTREIYDKIGGLDSMPTCSGDCWFWYKLLGISKYPYPQFYVPYNTTNIMNRGLIPDVKVACSMEKCTHIFHGEANTRLYKAQNTLGRLCTSYPFEDIEFDPSSDELTKWRTDTSAGIIHRECKKILEQRRGHDMFDDNAMEECQKIYDDVSEKLYGKIDKEHPLVILTTFEKGPDYDTWIVQNIKKMWDKCCLTPHRFICITNEKIEGVETIPFELEWKNRKQMFNQQEIFRKLFDENTSVLAVDLDVIPIREFKMHRCPENYMSMTVELNNWYRGRVLWNAGIMYFRGDFSFVYDEYKKRAVKRDLTNPSFCFISSQEFISGVLFKHDVQIHDVMNHISLELYRSRDKVLKYPRENSKVVHFLAECKPWNMDVPWMIIRKPK